MRTFRMRPAVSDAAWAGVLAVALTALIIGVPEGPDTAATTAAAVCFAIVQAASLTLMRRWPEAAMGLAIVAGIGIETLAPQVGWLGLAAAPLISYARIRPPRFSLCALGVMLALTPWTFVRGGWPEPVFAALRAGASGFLLKDIRPADLADAVRVVARGEALLAPTVTRRLLDRFAAGLPAGPGPDRRLDPLTPREAEVLTLVARALTNAEIAERLFLTQATVKTHISAILTKLGLRDRVQAAVLAYETGLVRPGAISDPA